MDDFTSFYKNSTDNESKLGSYRTQQSLMVFSLLLNVLGNISLTFALIKLKKSKEVDFPDMKQHFVFLSIVYSLFNILGSFLVYPLWFNIYHGASNGHRELRREPSTSKCKLAVLFTSFTVSSNIILHVALSVDRCLNWVFPFHYLLYKRKKHSRIPTTIVFCSTCLAATWSVIAAYVSGKVTKVQRKSGFLCIPDVTAKSPAVSFGLALGYICLLTLGLSLTLFLVYFFKTKSERKLVRKHRGGRKLLPRLPVGMPLFLAFTLTGFLFWTPFLVTATVAQFYSVGHTTFLVMFSLLFIPSLIHPFVTYVIFDDAREKFHELLESAWTFIKLRFRS